MQKAWIAGQSPTTPISGLDGKLVATVAIQPRLSSGDWLDH
jgi:hypothetical protein